ncbi:hypothetical protein GUITHDRAFT_101733 [Guillardia theta CCMP2712]|uniref:WW domain-containing protein n=1 Tax=Guillardia theta (strain CCMP2712) TaxID=905079 RepID=L1JVF2_GUITC|nr:hypothetical protein GUITHDRAFT_101733 [Guillardia theta CCMP2712]EKX52566.1 hypothetical protein GUITHDRAFT_101733 [Guillardia theta CCMP2712]|eukprot:XP_005839546.1 hypothetical protein GUITHDRAFT_101733 [Guillardia theta CCMP2712]
MTSIRLRGGSQPAQAHALWVSCQDPSSGRTYFYEMNSRLTSWVLPPGAVLYGKLGSNGQLEIAQHSSSETPVQTAASREETAVPVKAQDATMNTQSGPSEQAKAPSAPIPGNQPVPSQEATAISTAESKNDPGASQEGLQRDGLLHSTNQPAPTQAPQHIASQHEVSIVTPTAQPVAQPSLVQTPVQQREEQKHAAFTSQQPAAAQQVPQGATQGAHYAQGANSGTWKETIDPVSGRKYYYNTITRATSWHLPVDNQLALNSAGATRNSTFNLSNLARRFEDNLVNATRSVEGLWSRIGGLTKVFASSKKPADKPTDWYFDEEKQTWLKKNGTTSVNSEASEPNRQVRPLRLLLLPLLLFTDVTSSGGSGCSAARDNAGTLVTSCIPTCSY